MSLTTFLKNIEVEKKFKEEIRYPVFKSNAIPLAVPQTKHYSLVGTAFDYLLRFFIERINENVIIEGWVAFNGLRDIKNQFSNDVYQTGRNIILSAEKNYKKYLDTKIITNEMLSDVLKLAKLDIFFRSGCIDDLNKVDNADVEDLKYLYKLINPDEWYAKSVCILNPTFNEASLLVGGADADIIIDDMLIDIKTTKKLELKKDYINQLVGYYILYKIEELHGIKKKKKDIEILKLGIYFSRFGILKVFYIEDIINLDTLPQFIQWFIGQCNITNDRIKKNKVFENYNIEPKITQFNKNNSKLMLDEIGNFIVTFIEGKELEFYDKYYNSFINAEDFKNRYVDIIETINEDYKLEDLTQTTFESFIIIVNKWGDFQI
ncbi:MAG: hypothetical protein AB7V48_17095 [Sedimentibacter sp.]